MNDGAPAPTPRLASVNGPAPLELVQAWRIFSAWPDAAIQAVWLFLQPLVESPRNTRAADAARVYCQQYGIGRGEAGEVGSALHNLLLRAASVDLPAGHFAQDLAALGGGPAAATLAGGYPAAKQAIRMRLLRSALTDHGKVMTGVSWRVDQIGDTDAARQLASSVLVLTLKWKEGETNGRITLQVTPDAVADLRSILQRFGV